MFDGPASLFSCPAGIWGEGGYGDGSTHYAWLSSIALLPWLPGFPPQAFPTTVSSLTSPWSVCLPSTAALPWDWSTILKLQLPATALSREHVSLSRVSMAIARTVWFSFHLGCHRSAVSLSALNVSPLTQTVALIWGSDPLLQFPHPPKTGPVLLTLLFPPSSFILPSFAWFYTFSSDGQVLLSALSCCWCIPDVSMERDVLHVHLLPRHLVLLF